MKAVRTLGRAAIACLFSAAAIAGTPHLVRDINTATAAVSSTPGDFHDQGSWSFVNAKYDGQSYRPFATDGTAAGTVRLDSINPLSNSVTGYQPMKAGNLTFFVSTGIHLQSTLWVTDGTAAGTHLVMDFLNIGTNAVLVGTLNNRVLFTLPDQSAGTPSLWASDGTPSGTVRITGPTGPSVNEVLVVDQKIFFLEFAPDNTVHPWVSDGTTAGTIKLADLPNTAPELAELSWMARAGQYVLFVASTTDSGRELWRIDTSSNAVSLVSDIAAGSASGVPSDGSRLVTVGNVVIFGASSSGSTTQGVWRSDGTPAGTYALTSATPTAIIFPFVSGLVGLFSVNPTGSRVFFLADDGTTGLQLYATDGTVAGTARLTSDSSQLAPLGFAGSSIYYNAGPGGPLWRSDGTPAGTRAVGGVPSGQAQVAGNDATAFIRVTPQLYRYDLASDSATPLLSRATTAAAGGVLAYTRNHLYFDATDTVHGDELWISDGTAGGTQLLANLAPELGSPSSPAGFVQLNGKLYFSADDGVSGRELWTSDGTQAGTQLVMDLNPGSAASNPVDGFSAAGKLYFFAKDATGNYQFWQSDGTAPGTTALTAVTTLTPPSVAQPNSGCLANGGVAVGTKIFFTASDPTAGLELWKTDGTSAGTARVLDINPGTAGSGPCYLTAFNGRLYFEAGTAQSGLELWSSDGTAAGTNLVLDIAPGALGSQPRYLVVSGGTLYFLATDVTHGVQTWQSDGTAAGTVARTNFTLGGAYTDTGPLVPVNGQLTFLASTTLPTQVPSQLWMTDSSPAGASQISGVKVIGTSLTANAGHAFFTGFGPSGSLSDTEPWVTDGTAAGTLLLADMTPGTAGSAPILFADFHGQTLIQVSNGAGGAALWRTDATPSGTTFIGNIGSASTQLKPLTHLTAGQSFFYTSDGATTGASTGAELYALSNDPPIAANDFGTVQAGQSVTINVLTNDSDPDGSLNASSVRIVTPPTQGTVTVNPSGSVTYAPNASASTSDSFSYTVDDTQGGRSPPAAVNVSITAPPPANNAGGSSGGGTGSSGGGGSSGTGGGSSGGTGSTGTGGSPSSSSGGGGGGSLGLLELLLLATLVWRCVVAPRRYAVSKSGTWSGTDFFHPPGTWSRCLRSTPADRVRENAYRLRHQPRPS
jgi:ELWxxDGT repeat protein